MFFAGSGLEDVAFVFTLESYVQHALIIGLASTAARKLIIIPSLALLPKNLNYFLLLHYTPRCMVRSLQTMPAGC